MAGGSVTTGSDDGPLKAPSVVPLNNAGRSKTGVEGNEIDGIGPFGRRELLALAVAGFCLLAGRGISISVSASSSASSAAAASLAKSCSAVGNKIFGLIDVLVSRGECDTPARR